MLTALNSYMLACLCLSFLCINYANGALWSAAGYISGTAWKCQFISGLLIMIWNLFYFLGSNNCSCCLFEDGWKAPSSSFRQTFLFRKLLVYVGLIVSYATFDFRFASMQENHFSFSALSCLLYYSCIQNFSINFKLTFWLTYLFVEENVYPMLSTFSIFVFWFLLNSELVVICLFIFKSFLFS